MKADLSRNTFDAGKHYSSVRMQQGRVQLDADWNEQQDITGHRVDTATADVLGPLAAPAAGSGFQLSAPGAAATVAIGKGRIYVGGVLCENDADGLTLATQPDLPAAACVLVGGKAQGLPAPKGLYVGFIHVWQRHLTALEDPAIREMALGGPDTATRVKTLWQVQLLQASTNPAAALGCLSDIPAWNTLVQPPTGQLAVRAEPSPDPANPCKLSPTAGYRRLDNLLYRVEAHLMPGADPAFKWSHDNGSIETSWRSATPGSAANQLDLGVATIGRDPVLAFGPGQWAELFDDTTELLGRPGTLVKVVKAQGDTVTVDITASQVFPAGAPTAIAQFPANPRLRRWDGWDSVKQATAASVAGGWYELEDGVQVKFKFGAMVFRHGDYWTFAARTATQLAGATVQWPLDAGGNPVYRPQEGVPHQWGRLAMLAFDGSTWTLVSDCRPLFPSLTELTTLSYVGGDAQTVFGSEPLALPRPLEVGVAMGALPVGVATVRFTAETGTLPNGTATQDVPLAPADKGIAKIAWTLAAGVPHQYARAELLEGGAPSTSHDLPVHFSASIADQDCACTVCVSPQAQKADPLALQKAIDTVIQRGGGVVCLDVGDYPLAAALQVTRAQGLVLRGKGSASRLLGTGALLLVQTSNDVRVEALALDSSGVGMKAFATVGIQDTQGIVVGDVQVIVEPAGTQGVAVFVTGKLADLRLQRCGVSAAVGMVGGAMPGTPAQPVSVEGLELVDCRFACTASGITLQLNDFSRPVRVQGCRFEDSAGWAVAISGSSKAGTPIELVGNSVQVAAGVGLAATAAEARVIGNHIVCPSPSDDGYGIFLTTAAKAGGDVVVCDNHISGFEYGVAVLKPAARLRVAGNQISAASTGITVVDTGAITAVVTVESNQIADLGLRPSVSAPTASIAGIFVFGAAVMQARGNALQRIGLAATAAGTTILGIVGFNCGRIQLTDNDVLDFAPPAAFAGVAVGVSAFLPYADVDISGNRIRRNASGAPGDTSLWGGLYAGQRVLAQAPPTVAGKRARRAGAAVAASKTAVAQIGTLFKFKPDALQPTVRAPAVPGATTSAAADNPASTAAVTAASTATSTATSTTAGGPATAAAVSRPTALPDAVTVLARGNQVNALGLGACVMLTGTTVTFVDNLCQRLTGTLTAGQQLVAPVILFGFALTASHNVVDGAEDRQFTGAQPTSMQLTAFKDGRVTVLGNHTSGQIMVGPAVLGAPWAPLNVLL